MCQSISGFSISLVRSSILVLIVHCLNYYDFKWALITPEVFFFKIVLNFVGPLHIHVGFSIRLSILKREIRILIGLNI